MTKIYFSLLLSMLFYLTNAQVAQYGNITVEELEGKYCPIDSSAKAYYIYDFGDVSFDEGEYFKRFSTRISRIKILDQSAASLANVDIYLQNGQYPDVLEELEVISYNLEVDGSISKTRLNKKDLIEDKGNPLLTKYSAIAPNVKAGTVIELKYTISSYTKFLDDWNFQHTVPILSSEFKLHTIQYFSYVFLTKGISSFSKDTSYIDDQKYVSGRSRLNVAVNNWEVKNVPAFEFEPFCYSPENYRSRITFQLSQTSLPYAAKQNFLSSWEEVNATLLKLDNFGFFMLGNKQAIKEIAQNFDTIADKLKRVKGIINYIKTNFAWNSSYSLFTSSSMKDFLTKKVGNSADINLLLCTVLNYCDIESYPAAISNRNRGFIYVEYPFVEQLNNVIIVSLINGKAHLFDATNDLLPWNFIPYTCLSTYGLVVDESTEVNFVPIAVAAQSGVQTFTALAYNESEKGFKGKTKIRLQGYESAEYRTIYKLQGHGGLHNLIQENFIDSRVDSIEFQEFEDVLVVNADIAASSEKLYERILLSPILYAPDEINPFTSKTRNLPIDLPFPRNDRHLLTIKIPEGYKAETLPENVKLALPNNELIVTFSASATATEIQILYQINIQTQYISKDVYADLKAIYKQIEQAYTSKISLIPVKK